MRKVLIGAAIAFVALIALALIAMTQIDPKNYIGLVEARVEAATGRELKIDGDVGYTLSLLPTVAVEGVRLQNAPWGSRPDMLTVKRVEIQIALLPLLRGNVQVRGLTLLDPDVLLEVDAKGAKNWDFQSGEQPSEPADAPTLPPIEVRRARIDNASLAYRDAQANVSRQLALATLTVTGSGDRIELKAEAVLDSIALELAAEIDHGGRLGVADATGKGEVRLTGPGVSILAKGILPVSISGLAGLDVELDTEITNWDTLAKLAQSDLPKLPALKAEATARANADKLAFDAIKASLGRSSFSGSIQLGLGEKHKALAAQLDSPFVDLAEIFGADQPEKPSPDGRLFSAEPFAFDGLRALDGKAEVRIAKLAMRDGKTLDGVNATASFKGGKINADPVTISVEGKPLRIRAQADVSSGKSLALNLAIDGQGLSLGTLGALLDISGTPEGSPTDLAVRFASTGTSVRGLMASANADVRIVIGPGRIRNRVIELGADVSELLNAINPARVSDPYTELRCAVIRLPIRRGVANIDNSIAAETAKVNVIVAGVIDFRNETLDLGVRPKAATGLGIGLGSLANLGRLRGSLAAPKVEIDFSGTAKAASELGIAAVTSGLSLLAGGLLTESVPDQPCQAALSGTARATPRPGPVEQIQSLGGSVVQGIKKLFGK